MKIALCLSGLIGNVEKWLQGREIDYNYGYKYIRDSILDFGDVDVFIHSYSVEHQEGIEDLYQPVSSVFEPNLDFKLRGEIPKKDLPIPAPFCIKSMWYSRNKSVELAAQYEQENNFKYDLVLLTRFDIALFRKFQFDEYDTSRLYIAGPIIVSHATDGQGIRPHKINDIYFLGNTENLLKVTSVSDTYEGIAINLDNNWPLQSVSSHRVIAEHFINEGLFEITECLFERPWQPSMTWAGDIRFLRADPNLKFLEN